MTAATLLVLAVGASLAYANGSNDVSKGIATLVGSGVTDHRRAIVWGTAWTGVGGVLGALFAGAMLTTFGKGLLTPGTTPTFASALAVLVGAAGWVLFATRTGLPVSTTHAIVGSLVGVAALTYGVDAVKWDALGGKVFLPLLVTPFASLLITGVLLRATPGRLSRGGVRADCVCAEVEPAMVAVSVAFAQSAALVAQTPRLRISTGSAEACATTRPGALRLTVDHLHWLTSGATSLARGMNDAPKIVALVLAASVLLGGATISTSALFGLVAVAMVIGSLVAGRRVTHVLATKVTPMDHHEGFAANLVTAGLVTAGAVYGLPMSTTHISSAGIFSAGIHRGTLNRKTLRDILLAWVVTLPAAAMLGMAAYAMARLALGAAS
ncbi:MAG: inorganic phosphate transporter [Actinomycetota bacterium]|nr:inorganic phosphate transporter [Actinomycetota bacterium]